MLIPKSTLKLETTTSLADKPEISATATCHRPRPAGRSTGTSTWPIMAAKLSCTSDTKPVVPVFNTNHSTMEAIKIVVPALLR